MVRQKCQKKNFIVQKKKNWNVNTDNIITSNLIETKIYFIHLIGYLDEFIRPLVLILPKMSGYVKRSIVKAERKDKNNKLMFPCK